MSGRGGRDADVARRDARREPTKEPRARRGRALAGEAGLPKYQPDIALRAIDGHLTRTATQVMAWYRLAAQAWSFRSDAQREVLIRQIAAQLGELQGRWLHLRVTTRPYPVHMWAESFDHNALGRMPDVAGALGWDGFLEGEQRHLMGLSMSDKEVFLGFEVSGRGMLDRWVERAAPVLGRVVPKAVRAELEALRSEIGHLDALVAGSGLDAVPASADDLAWLMHRSCALGLPAPRTLAVVPAGAHWEAEDLAGFTDGVEMFQEPYAPTVRVVGRLRSQTVQRNVAVLSIGLMDGLRIPEVDDPWMQHSDRLPFPVEWSARMYVRRPEEVAGELQRQMGKVRSQIRHYTHDHDLDPPMSLARQADRVLEVEDELTTGLTQLNSRLYGWWRIAVSGKDENEAVRRAQQVLDVYRPKVQIEHPEAQYRYAREGEEHAGVVADFLDERRELPQAALLFPDTTRDDPWHVDREYRLTVLTMQGMTLPRPGSPREEWTDAEGLAVELLNLASWLTQRTIYDADRNLRKGVALDETHFLSQVPTGKVLIDRLARDSRKFNVRALFASQLAGDLLRVSGFASLVNAVFVGRTDDGEAQSEALRLLRVPTGVGYEQMLGTLSPRPRHDDRPDDTPRQFIFADGHGGVEKIRIDLEAPHLEHVRQALDTNPDARRVMTRGVPSAAVRAPDEPAARRPVQAHPDPDVLELDDPDGLLDGSGSDPPELLDDEELDLLEEHHVEPSEGAGRNGDARGGPGRKKRVRAAGEAVR